MYHAWLYLNFSWMFFVSDTTLCLKEVLVKSFFKSQYSPAKVINGWVFYGFVKLLKFQPVPQLTKTWK